MGEIRHTERFAEIERIFGDYFNCHLAPVMRDTQSYLNRKQVEEMAEYSTSAAGILSSMAAANNPMIDPYQTLKITGEWNSKTTEDYLAMVKDKISGNKDMQTDLAMMAGEWRSAVIGEIGRDRYDTLSGQLGCDLAYAYTDYRMEQLMIDRLVKERMPKSSADYIIRKAAQNTLLGLSATLGQSPLAAEIEQRGEAAYKPSKLEKGTSRIIGAGIDALSLGGVGSWTSFAKFVGVDLAFSALAPSQDNKGNGQSVEDCISKGVFGSEANVFADFRKQAKNIQKDENPYIIATNERLAKKIPIETFDFTKWMSEHTITSKPMWSLADEKKNEERYKNVPLVIMPEYREAYLQNSVQKQGKKAEKTTSAEVTQQKKIGADEQILSRQADPEKTSQQSHSEAVTQEEQGQQTVQSDTCTNENGWNGLFSSLGLNGMGDIGRNLGYVFSMLPDILVGMFTGRTKSLDIGDNIVPMASVLAGLFVKNPVLKMLMIGLGGANLLNKAGHEAIDWKRNEGNSRPVSENRHVQYRSYPDEPLNPRISNPILKGNNLIATIDRVPCTIQLPEKVTAAYQAGALPLNTLANAILAKSDQTRAMMERNFENGERETIIRTRGIQ